MFSKNQPASSLPKTVETIIGPSVKVEGNFKGEGDLIIEGILVGDLQTKNNLKIGQNSVIDANIRANNAFISGRVRGNITVNGKLEITGTAIILGDIKAQMISIESGALIKGKLNMPVQDFKTDELGPSENSLSDDLPADSEAELENN